MGTKHFSLLSRIVLGGEAGSAKKYLVFLVLVTAFGASGYYPLSERVSNTSWDVTCSSTVRNHHFVGAVIQQKGVIPDNEDSHGLGSKDSPERGSVLVTYSSSDFIQNSGSEALLDSINSFHYVLIYGYSPLRSPPVLS
jgi:hypothetical protein